MSCTILKIAPFPRFVSKCSLKTTVNCQSGHGIRMHNWWSPEKIAGREVVGFGLRGDEYYEDRLDVWYPAIRFRTNDEVITPIREKELGDWKKLTLEEKKLLYRYSFCQTMAEFKAPNGYWKIVWAIVISITGVTILYACLLQRFVYPATEPQFDNEFKEAQVEKRLVMEKGRFYASIAPLYDYENNRWKD